MLRVVKLDDALARGIKSLDDKIAHIPPEDQLLPESVQFYARVEILTVEDVVEGEVEGGAEAVSIVGMSNQGAVCAC